MGQARQRGTYQQRKDQAEFYASENKRYQQWLKDNRPMVEFISSHGTKLRYKPNNRVRKLLAMAVSIAADTDCHIQVIEI